MTGDVHQKVQQMPKKMSEDTEKDEVRAHCSTHQASRCATLVGCIPLFSENEGLKFIDAYTLPWQDRHNSLLVRIGCLKEAAADSKKGDHRKIVDPQLVREKRSNHLD